MSSPSQSCRHPPIRSVHLQLCRDIEYIRPSSAGRHFGNDGTLLDKLPCLSIWPQSEANLYSSGHSLARLDSDTLADVALEFAEPDVHAAH